jgi:hypothetical protein
MLGKKTTPKQPPRFPAQSKAVCINFCSYYRPDKAEDLACRGFTVIEGLMKKGRQISFEKRAEALSHSVSEVLSANLCSTCPFREDGCDFASGKKHAPPCGGFLLLGHLIGSGTVHIDDLANIV